jgi:hypothetical protein
LAGTVGAGHFSKVKGVGSGVFECKIDFGPGYRIYFAKDGESLERRWNKDTPATAHHGGHRLLGRVQTPEETGKKVNAPYA